MVKKSTVILFGSSADPEVKQRSRKLTAGGRKVLVQSSTTHPDGTGPCGKICSCNTACKNDFALSLTDVRVTENQGVFKTAKRV